MLPGSLPDGEEDLVLGTLDESDVHVHMANVFGEGSTGTADGDDSRLDADIDTVRDRELFELLDVQHLRRFALGSSERDLVHPA